MAAGFDDEEGQTGPSLPFPGSWGGAAARVLAKKQEMVVGSAVCGGGGYTFVGWALATFGPPARIANELILLQQCVTQKKKSCSNATQHAVKLSKKKARSQNFQKDRFKFSTEIKKVR